MKLIIVREAGGLAVVAEGLPGGPWKPLAASYRPSEARSPYAVQQLFKDFVNAAAEALDAEVEDRS